MGCVIFWIISLKEMDNRYILLIQPSNKLLNKKDNLYTNEALTPSLGLASVASYCRERGIKVRVIDLRLRHYSLEQVLEVIEKEPPLLIGITAFTNEIVKAGVLASLVKARYPHIPIVIGGPHSSLMPQETLSEFKDFDIAVIGEGENTLVEIKEALMANNSQDRLLQAQGIALRLKDGSIKLNPARPVIADINKIPLPAWDLFELSFYNKIFVISTSRGCPYGCYFCSPNYLGRKVRVKDPLRVVDEIEYLVKEFGAKNFQFADATLSLLGEKTILLCDEIIRRGLADKIEWDCETRADSLNLNLLKKMHQAGCRWVALGVETGNARILKDVVRKQETKDQIREARKLARKAGLKVRCFFILGHLTETIETIKETINFALELNPDALSFGLLVPNPGSEVRQIAERGDQGFRLLSNNWENYNQFNHDCLELKNLSLPELKKWRSNAYYTFYMHHPIKALGLFLDPSGYNYNLRALFKIPFMLLRQKMQ